MTAPGWTVDEALADFAAAGAPLDEAGFRWVVRRARATGHLEPVDAAPPGKSGGRRYLRYDIDQMQGLHADLAKWIGVPSDDQADAAAARRARASIEAGEPVIPWEEVKAEAGLDVPSSARHVTPGSPPP